MYAARSPAKDQRHRLVMFGRKRKSHGGVLSEGDDLQPITWMDFREVAHNYRVIDKDEVNILVPHPGQETAFSALLASSKEKGVTEEWEERARALSVAKGEHGIQRGSELYEVVEPLKSWNEEDRALEDCGDWFVYVGKYDPELGVKEKAFVPKS
jgi:hypothetical protein